MAGPNIPPLMLVEGVAHRVEKRELKATETLPAREIADVVVLTDDGGFASVYLDQDHVGDVPAQGERVRYRCAVGIWNRQRRDGQGTYAELTVRLVQRLDVPSLHSVTAEAV